jgi:hypothetical protein
VSQEDKVYPTSDRLRFDEGPEVVYVYLRVEDFATYEDLEARVGRTSRVSALGRVLGGGGGELVVSKEGEERLTVTYGEASGVVKFAFRQLHCGGLWRVGRGPRKGRGGQKILCGRRPARLVVIRFWDTMDGDRGDGPRDRVGRER